MLEIRKFALFRNHERIIMSKNITRLYNKITAPVVCGSCLQEYQDIINPSFALRDFIAIDVGFTEFGLQVWCRKHDKNICHIDFNGQKLESDFRCLEKSGS